MGSYGKQVPREIRNAIEMIWISFILCNYTPSKA